MKYVIILIFILILVKIYCIKKKKTILELIHPDWFKHATRFPEYAFPCQKNCTRYYDDIKKGFSHVENKKIVFGGLCINIHDKIPDLIKRIEQLGSFFKEYKFVVFENDSTDGTRELLEQYDNVILVPCGTEDEEEDKNCKLNEKPAVSHGSSSSKRMEKMSNYRNRLLKFIIEYFNNYDYVCFMDLDLVGSIDIRGFIHSFGYQWDCISAQGLHGVLGIPMYYDTFAYKDENLHVNSGNKMNMTTISIKASRHKVGDLPYKVKSGFGGLAIYQMDSIRNIDYTPKDGNYSQCDHIFLHDNMIDHGFDKIYINPNMLILVGLVGSQG